MSTNPNRHGEHDDEAPLYGSAESLSDDARDGARVVELATARRRPSPYANPDTDPDTTPDAAADAEPDITPDTDPDTEPGTEPDSVSDVREVARREPDAAEVIEGRVLSPVEAARVTVLSVRSVPGAVRAAATSERSVTTVKAVTRNVLYVPGGALSVVKRLWEASTTARHQRMMRGAELAGNAELLAEWETRAEAFRNARHRRLMDWVAAPFVLAKGLLIGSVSVLFLLLGFGVLLACARQDAGALLAPMRGFLTVVNTVAIAVAIAWTPFIVAAPWVAVLALWNEGRRHQVAPSWLATADEGDLDIVIDERTIAQALLALRIPQITAALKVAPLQFLTTARRDGRGTHAVVRLPAGVTAEKIATRRADLATGLYRLSKEVWPTTGSEAGVLDLWIADKGALAEGAGPYPLLDEGKVDVFKGVPFGKTLRGDPITAPIMERNTIDGGMPGQGKSSASRAIAAGVALDPSAELRIWVPDTNFDFEAFKPRCSRYVMGAEDEHFEAIVDDLRDLHAEVQRRGELLVKYEIPAVTHEYASKGVGLHPLVCLLEEAHVLIQHPVYGKEASQLLVDIVRLGRKRGIHLIVSTQAPTKDSMPRDVTRNCSNGIAFAVGDHVANDALLGQGAYRAGHRATELIPGTDRGTAVVKGFSGQRSEIVQVYFIDVDKDHDQITPIINRSLKVIADLGRPVPGTGKTRRTPALPPARRDLLEDLAAVLQTDPVPAADVPALLAHAYPGWAPYRTLTGKALRALLDKEHGIKVPSTGNRYPLDPATVRDALARRPDPQDDAGHSDKPGDLGDDGDDGDGRGWSRRG